jgi:hypothetical protein
MIRMGACSRVELRAWRGGGSLLLVALNFLIQWIGG